MDLLPATLADLLWEFGRAETQNDRRHGRMYSQGLGPELYRNVRSDRRAKLSRADWGRLRSTIESTRPEYVSPLLSLDLAWKSGWVETGALAELRIPDLDLFRPLAPSRRLAEFTASLDGEGSFPGVAVARNYHRIRGAFEPARMCGAPIVVAERSTGPFTIVEGMTRLSVLCSEVQRAEPVPPGIRLVVGLGPRAKDWRFY